MPEGPEIRIAADRVQDAVAGRPLMAVELLFPRLKKFQAVLKGQVVDRIDTRGKAMLTRFDNGLTLYSHNQLYGRWYVRPRGQLPRTNRRLRVALHTEETSALLYSATDVEILDSAAVEAHPFLNKLGPDVLDPELGWSDIASRLLEKRFAARTLSSLYLDQAFIAGIGNYLRSEILFAARIEPSRAPQTLNRSERARLARQTLAVSRRSYRTRGTTISQAQLRRRRDSGERGRDRVRFAIFARDGSPCDTCGATILKKDAGARRLYLCPICQV